MTLYQRIMTREGYAYEPIMTDHDIEIILGWYAVMQEPSTDEECNLYNRLSLLIEE